MDSSIGHESAEIIVPELLLCSIAEMGKKTVTVIDWITKVRDTIKGLLPDYYFIICKYPRPFTQYIFQDLILDWCYQIKDLIFKVLVFSESVIKDYEEIGEITKFCCGGPGKIERVRKDNNNTTKNRLCELKFIKKEFNKADLMDCVYKMFEVQLPELRTNPKKYLPIGRYSEYTELCKERYAKTDVEQIKMKKYKQKASKILSSNCYVDNLDTLKNK